jgi:hypothetical protein
VALVAIITIPLSKTFTKTIQNKNNAQEVIKVFLFFNTFLCKRTKKNSLHIRNSPTLKFLSMDWIPQGCNNPGESDGQVEGLNVEETIL